MSIRNFFKWENSISGSGGDLCADIESQLKPEGYLPVVRSSPHKERALKLHPCSHGHRSPSEAYVLHAR